MEDWRKQALADLERWNGEPNDPDGGFAEFMRALIDSLREVVTPKSE